MIKWLKILKLYGAACAVANLYQLIWSGVTACPFLLPADTIFVTNLIASRVPMIVIWDRDRGEKYGRIGNRLTRFAHLMAFGIENDLIVADPSFVKYARYFKSTSTDLLCRNPARGTLLHWDPLRRSLQFGFPGIIGVCRKLGLSSEVALKPDQRLDLEDPKNLVQFNGVKCVFVAGWLFEAPNLVYKHRGAILKSFEPLDKYNENIERKLVEAKKNSDLLIGVHIRRGDYRTFLNGLYFYEIADYRRFMKETMQLFPDKRVGFLVCSDEKLDDDDFRGFNYVLGNGPMIEDLYSLAKCDLIVGPPSTFSLWASFYGNVPYFPVKHKSVTFNLDEFRLWRAPGFDI